MSEQPTSPDPYLFEIKSEEIRMHNPDFEQNAECDCGHPYHRHFDGYDPIGCKYCMCVTWRTPGTPDPNEPPTPGHDAELTYEFEVIAHRIGGPVRGYDLFQAVVTDPEYNETSDALFSEIPLSLGDWDGYGCEGAGHFTEADLPPGRYKLTIERLQ